ncbi:hypothetical protein CONCODRAFT_4315 [Conidiobolus coronatus NRRL 28638]|uniref:Multicopper oxidase n=1 Tax=Conidiobolus coronatus (strain ATCC 28846 / CBS 209.66 / NRRL 28638) TaxID=796925 RepID=A0A137PCT9_CONC2|nr:hypothetical protein CONCODRAFT_4315 [Conidiobolus coronatus NRRL 28638]|eukprot:KXN72818.1 hypothetical protein CONCODRAFT_4315 [Conidiobolus coronatus NRRL 28638]
MIYFNLIIWSYLNKGVFSAIVTYNLTITLETGKPNCFNSLQVLVNKQFPAPLISASVNDTLVVNIINQLPKDDFTMHYHGLHQKSTPFFDGVPSVTQRAIAPGMSFQHRIRCNQPGTYLYHSHTKFHAITAIGPLIIYDNKEVEPFKYDGERIVLLTDSLLTLKSSPPYRQGKLAYKGISFNGRTNIDALSSQLDLETFQSWNRASDPQCKLTYIDVEENKVYRLRLIGGTSSAYMSFSIQNHQMEVVEVEGHYVQRTVHDRIPIHSGQRYSVLITTNQISSSYRMNTYSMMPNGKAILSGVAYLRYLTPVARRISDKEEYGDRSTNRLQSHGNFDVPDDIFDRLEAASDHMLISENQNYDLQLEQISEFDDSPTLLPRALQNVQLKDEEPLMDIRLDYPHFSEDNYKAPSYLFKPLHQPPLPNADRRIYFRVTHEEREEEDQPKWFVNGTHYKTPVFNLLKAAYDNQLTQTDSSTYGLTSLKYNEVVDIIIQNTVDLAGVCDNHPWHLHGHSFWDLGSGPGTWNPSNSTILIKEPILRDTFTFSLGLPVGNLEPKTDCGWHAIRFKVDNPGIWLFHCHIVQHLESGMKLTFNEALNMLPPLPSDQ